MVCARLLVCVRACVRARCVCVVRVCVLGCVYPPFLFCDLAHPTWPAFPAAPAPVRPDVPGVLVLVALRRAPVGISVPRRDGVSVSFDGGGEDRHHAREALAAGARLGTARADALAPRRFARRTREVSDDVVAAAYGIKGPQYNKNPQNKY